VAFSVRELSRFVDDGKNCVFGEVGDFFVAYDFLCDKPGDALLVFKGVRDRVFHEDFIPISSDSASKRRVHVLDGFYVSCCDHDEAARGWFCADHGSCATLALSGDSVFSFL